jgi:hypothetical protein
MAGSYTDFEFMEITITDTTDRDMLLAIIRDLDEERNKLHDGWEEASDEAENLREKVRKMKHRLAKAADLLADKGFIHNTPAAKYQWTIGN